MRPFLFLDRFHLRKPEWLARRTPPLFGLVLAGGRSSRMKRDKAQLNYHGKPQVRHVFGLLEGVCRETFISARDDQEFNDAPGMPLIRDRFLGFGPAGGILSAMEAHPEAAWLVVACDLPFLDQLTLEVLLKGRNPSRIATSFRSGKSGLPEPLCAIWEPRSRYVLARAIVDGNPCPRRVLLNCRIQSLSPPMPHALENVNDPRAYKAALQRIEIETMKGARKSHA